MKSEITVRTQGIKGGNAKFETKGCVTLCITDRGQKLSDLVIDADSFTGSGRTYKHREKTLINIDFESQPIFRGTIEELVAKLKPDVQIVSDERTDKIKRIKDILGVWGATSCAELNRDHSPCKNSIGEGKSNVSELIEQFDANGVSAVTYNDELEIGWNDYNYEDLSDDLIDEIFEIIEEYEADMLKTESRCQD
jgi:hypothetical protein